MLPPRSQILGAYLTRWLRLVPALLFALLFLTWVTPLPGAVMNDKGLYAGMFYGMPRNYQWGMWYDVVEKCQYYFWENLLFVNNFFPLYQNQQKECCGWTWFLAADMQLFLLLPWVILCFQHMRSLGFLLVGLLCAAQVLVFVTTDFDHEFDGTNMKSIVTSNLVDSVVQKGQADDLYIRPWCHFVPFFCGVGFKYLLPRVRAYRPHWPGFVTAISTSIALLGMAVCIFGPPDRDQVQQWPQWCCLGWVTLAPFLWSLALCLLLFAGTVASSCGQYNPVVKLLESNFFSVPSRLAYMVYLIHPGLEFIIFGQLYASNAPRFYNAEISFIAAPLFILASYIFAFVTYFLIEQPAANLIRCWLRPHQKTLKGTEEQPLIGEKDLDDSCIVDSDSATRLSNDCTKNDSEPPLSEILANDGHGTNKCDSNMLSSEANTGPASSHIDEWSELAHHISR